MPELGFQALAVLLVLLPGFLCARIIRNLCVTPHQTEFDKIIEALMYSFIVYVAYSLVFGGLPVGLRSTAEGDVQRYSIEVNKWSLATLLLLSLSIALGVSYLTNNDLIFRWLRKYEITRRTARGYVWGDVFHECQGYVLVELKDGRMLLGWLRYYPDTPEEGNVFLEDAAWVERTGKRIPIAGPGILITKELGIHNIAFLEPKITAVDSSRILPLP